jgi:hypothetical protein
MHHRDIQTPAIACIRGCDMKRGRGFGVDHSNLVYDCSRGGQAMVHWWIVVL